MNIEQARDGAIFKIPPVPDWTRFDRHLIRWNLKGRRVMKKVSHTAEFKANAVKQVIERGHSVLEDSS